MQIDSVTQSPAQVVHVRAVSARTAYAQSMSHGHVILIKDKRASLGLHMSTHCIICVDSECANALGQRSSSLAARISCVSHISPSTPVAIAAPLRCETANSVKVHLSTSRTLVMQCK